MKTADRPLLCLWLVMASGCDAGNLQTASTTAPEPPPNILIINADDLDFDELATYEQHNEPWLREMPSHTLAERSAAARHTGDEGQTLGYESVAPMITPNIDGLAQDGMLFSRFYVTSPLCTPSRFSLLTGKYASRSRHLRERTADGEPLIIGFNTPLDGEPTLPKLLQAQGYATGLVGKWHNFGGAGSARGNGRIGHLAEADPKDPRVAEALQEGHQRLTARLRTEAGFDYVGALYPGNVEEIGVPKQLYRNARHNLEWITEAALRFLDAHHDRPFFLYVAPTAPHGWMNGDIGSDEDALLTPAGVLASRPEADMPSRAAIQAQSRSFGRGRTMALWLDHAVGAILRRLDRHDLAKRTLVIFTSDHGNRGKESVYEGARAPFIARWHGRVPEGATAKALIGNIDITPTVMELAGGAPDAKHGFDGASFASVLFGETQEAREYLMLEMSVSRALVTKSFKYIANRPPVEIQARMASEARTLPHERRRHGWDANWSRAAPHGGWRRSPRINYGNHLFFPAYFDLDQLYDLSTDVLEQDNLYEDPRHRQVRDSMKALLAQTLRDADQQFGEFTQAPGDDDV